MGTPEFAVESLKSLLETQNEIVAVVTSTDKPAGRGQLLSISEVKKFALEKKLNILQPEKLKDETFIEQLNKLNVDLIVVVAFRMLPETVWNLPRLGTINLHASILPQYRGAAPINWAIINGETETGVSTFFIEKEIDTGKIIFCEKTEISESETAGELHNKLMKLGANLLVKTVNAIEAGNYPQIPQNQLVSKNETIKLAPKISKEKCRIDFDKTSQEIFNLIRGLNPYPAAWCTLQNLYNGRVVTMKVFETEKIRENHFLTCGEIITDEKTFAKIAVKDGFISLKNVQLESKKRLGIVEFLRGFEIPDWKILK